MSLIDFYENVFTVNGEKLAPLSPSQREIIEAYESLPPTQKIRILRGKKKLEEIAYKSKSIALNNYILKNY